MKMALKLFATTITLTTAVYANSLGANLGNKSSFRKDTEELASCEQSIFDCVSSPQCAACIHDMGEKDMDFTTLAHGKNCSEVIKPLVDEDVCSEDLQSDEDGKAIFCRTIDLCAVTSSSTYYYAEEDENVDDKDTIDDGDIDTEENFEDLQECIIAKCLIEVAACEIDYLCSQCIDPDQLYLPGFCNDEQKEFTTLMQCYLCECIDYMDEDGYDDYYLEQYCVLVEEKDDPEKQKGQLPECTAEESEVGVSAAFNYSLCSTVDFSTELEIDFDNDHFGRLDAFENCSISYNNETSHNQGSALDCMSILQTAIEIPIDGNDSIYASQVISRIANQLYTDGEAFCNCSAEVSEVLPSCDDYENLKTIINESLDACWALDQIDCAAWSEFSTQCQVNMETKFGNTAFTSETQCEYVLSGCGDAGPFPSFRRHDCESEIDTKSWGFHQRLANDCSALPHVTPPTEEINKTDPPTKTPSTKTEATTSSIPTFTPTIKSLAALPSTSTLSEAFALWKPISIVIIVFIFVLVGIFQHRRIMTCLPCGHSSAGTRQYNTVRHDIELTQFDEQPLAVSEGSFT